MYFLWEDKAKKGVKPIEKIEKEYKDLLEPIFKSFLSHYKEHFKSIKE